VQYQFDWLAASVSVAALTKSARKMQFIDTGFQAFSVI